jgi:hypothetical protein
MPRQQANINLHRKVSEQRQAPTAETIRQRIPALH